MNSKYTYLLHLRNIYICTYKFHLSIQISEVIDRALKIGMFSIERVVSHHLKEN